MADIETRVEVNVQGHCKRLFFKPGASSCDDKQGIALWFEGEGCWLIPLADLEKMLESVNGQQQEKVRT